MVLKQAPASQPQPDSGSRHLGLRRWIVALTPLLGAMAFPLLVPVLMQRLSLQAGMGAAVVIGSLWFGVMLRSAEMPGHDASAPSTDEPQH